MLLSAALISLAMLSYFFTFAADQDKIHGRAWDFILDKDIQVDNALGRLGAWISHQMIYLRWGVSAFLLSSWLAYVGSSMLYGRKLFRSVPYLLYALLISCWICTSMEFLFGSSSDILGGGIGRYLYDGLAGALGRTGTAMLLLFMPLAASALIWNFSFRAQMPKWFQKKNEEVSEENAELESENASVAAEDLAPTYQAASDLETAKGEDLIEVIEKNQVKETKKSVDSEIPKLDWELSTNLEDQFQESSITENNADALVLDTNSDLNGSSKTSGNSTAEKEEEELELSIVESSPELASSDRGSIETQYDPKLDLPNYEYPKLELLEHYDGANVKVDPQELETNKNRIVETLDHYGIRISKIKATIGPTVTLYEIVPAKGVRISKIKNLEDDIALSLSALGIRIIAPIPGKGTIGIEVPNVHKSIVGIRGILGSDRFKAAKMDLPVCLGKTISSENYVADLARMPHLLMAGATGQGKSVGINALLVSLLYKKHPSELKFILIDPKKVELSLFSKIEKHFLAKLPGEEEAIITDTKKVIHTLNALCMEMDARYDLLKKAQTRNIKEYNNKFLARKLNPNNGHRFLPFLVLIIDEFADLIMTAGKEVEMPIARLAQLARAVGIHLVIATQRPSVNIITGLIKSNFPARVAFKVTAKVDSRTILDTGGADQLIGRGDMLLGINSDIVRLQCPFVDTPEVERVCDFIGAQKAPEEPFLLPEYIDEKEDRGTISAADRDTLFEDAARIVVQHQQGSTSLIQRRLKLGYNRAGRLMDQLEAAGIVGPNIGSKAREVLVHSELDLEQFLDDE